MMKVTVPRKFTALDMRATVHEGLSILRERTGPLRVSQAPTKQEKARREEHDRETSQDRDVPNDG
jgi:hypothetical protein